MLLSAKVRYPCSYLSYIILNIQNLFHKSESSSAQFSSVQSSSVQFRSVQISSVQFRSVQLGSVQFGSVQFSSVQFSSVQFSSVQLSSVQFSSVQVQVGDIIILAQEQFCPEIKSDCRRNIIKKSRSDQCLLRLCPRL
jgi:uncharacterized protein YjbI with pentapeptide repeats